MVVWECGSTTETQNNHYLIVTTWFGQGPDKQTMRVRNPEIGWIPQDRRVTMTERDPVDE